MENFLKSSSLLPLFIVLFSCFQEKKNFADNNSVKNSTPLFNNDGKKTITFKDEKTSMIVMSTSYPKDWKFLYTVTYPQDPVIPIFIYRIQGSNGLQAFNIPTRLNVSAMNQQTYYELQTIGLKNLKPYQPIQAILKNKVHQEMARQGFEFIKKVAYPKLENKIKSSYNKIMTSPYNLIFMHTLWKDKKGNKAVVFMSQFEGQSSRGYNQMMTWQNHREVLVAKENYFDEAVSDFIEAVANRKINPEWDAYMKKVNQFRRMEADKRLANAQKVHEQRMQFQKQTYELHRKKMKNIYAENESRHQDFLKRNFSEEKRTENYINALTEVENVHHSNGNTYQIESGSSKTWMDDSGNYINTNDPFFNPNNYEHAWPWTKVKDN